MDTAEFRNGLCSLVRDALRLGVDVDTIIRELMDVSDVLCGEPEAPTAIRAALGYD